MSDDNDLTGWMAMLETRDEPCQERQQAREAASALGWTLDEEEPIDAAQGLWSVTLTQADAQALLDEGYLDKQVGDHHGLVEMP